MELVEEDLLRQQRQREDRRRRAQDGSEAGGPVEHAPLARGRQHAGRDADQQCQRHTAQHQLQRGRQEDAQIGAHAAPGRQRCTQVAVRQIVQIMNKLHGQRPVQA